MNEFSLPPSDEDDPSFLPRDEQNNEDDCGGDAAFHASLDPWSLAGFPSQETLRISRELAVKYPLGFRDQPGYPVAARLVYVMMESGAQGWARNAFRKRLTERISKLLPVGYSGPSRKIGEHDLEWENDHYLITLWQMNEDGRTALTVYTKYHEGIEKLDAVSRRLFNTLTNEYSLTTGYLHGKFIPYSPDDLD